MKVFLIVVAVLVVLICLILAISAEFTIVFDDGWSTKLRILFFEWDVKLTKLLSFIVAPDEAGQEAAEKSKEKKDKKRKEKEEAKDVSGQDTVADIESDIQTDNEVPEEQESGEDEVVTPDEVVEAPPSKETPKPEQKPKKKNPIQKILDEDGLVGILLLVSNLLQTVNSAATTLIKGLHIYSLYVKMIIGGGDAASIAEKFGAICGWYYPLKGMIVNQMKVDNYDEYLAPDFIAPRSEYEFQFIGSISVGLLIKVLLKAGKTFVVNFIKNR